MLSRRRQVESIIESIHTIKRRFMLCGMEKSSITPSQWAVLMIMIEHKTMSMKQLAEALGISGSGATQLVDGLVAKGFLVRENDIHDRRVLLLHISAKCKEKINVMRTHSIKNLESVFDALDRDELAQYAFLNKKISDHILNKNP